MLDASQLKQLGHATAAGAELATTVVLGTLLGQWLDDLLGTAPVLFLLLSLSALTLGIVRLSRNLQRGQDPSSDPDPELPTPSDHDPNASPAPDPVLDPGGRWDDGDGTDNQP